MDSGLREAHDRRRSVLECLATALEAETRDALRGIPHIDRIYFRVKGTDSFIKKAQDPRNDPAYENPLVEIEDQVAGRVIVFFLSNLDSVLRRLSDNFSTVESRHRRPGRDEEFGYESHHLICVIPPHVRPAEWGALIDPPNAFEMQVRTIFMHAYSEPQHDFAYKAAEELPREAKRELAWIAASAWGADQAYERLLKMLGEKAKVKVD